MHDTHSESRPNRIKSRRCLHRPLQQPKQRLSGHVLWNRDGLAVRKHCGRNTCLSAIDRLPRRGVIWRWLVYTDTTANFFLRMGGLLFTNAVVAMMSPAAARALLATSVSPTVLAHLRTCTLLRQGSGSTGLPTAPWRMAALATSCSIWTLKLKARLRGKLATQQPQ